MPDIIDVSISAPKEEVMEKVTDVVCGMEIDPATAAGTKEYNGQTYYFCSESCKTRFAADPDMFVK